MHSTHQHQHQGRCQVLTTAGACLRLKIGRGHLYSRPRQLDKSINFILASVAIYMHEFQLHTYIVCSCLKVAMVSTTQSHKLNLSAGSVIVFGCLQNKLVFRSIPAGLLVSNITVCIRMYTVAIASCC